ncbi:hypothetical protein D3C72_1601900 [compost metagenome]
MQLLYNGKIYIGIYLEEVGQFLQHGMEGLIHLMDTGVFHQVMHYVQEDIHLILEDQVHIILNLLQEVDSEHIIQIGIYLIQ